MAAAQQAPQRSRLSRGWRAVTALPVRLGGRLLRPFIRFEITRAAERGRFAPMIGGLWDALSDQQAQIQGLAQRVELVRAETMFELRAMAGAAGPDGARIAAAATVKDEAKLAAALAARSLRLNIGCGHLPLEGYVNVDRRDLPGVDLVADAAALGQAAGSVAEIFSAHLLEHFPLEHLRRVVLPHWLAALAPSGVLRAIVPDAEAMLRDHADGTMSFDDLREVTFGLQDYDGDFHFTMFARDQLAALLRDAGLRDVEYEFVGRRNGKCRDMAVRARKPEAAGACAGA